MQLPDYGELTKYVTTLKLVVLIWWRTLLQLNLVHKETERTWSQQSSFDVNLLLVYVRLSCSYQVWNPWGLAGWFWIGWYNIVSAHLWSSKDHRSHWTVVESHWSWLLRLLFVSLCFPMEKHMEHPRWHYRAQFTSNSKVSIFPLTDPFGSALERSAAQLLHFLKQIQIELSKGNQSTNKVLQITKILSLTT